MPISSSNHGFLCECGTQHEHKVISDEDWEKARTWRDEHGFSMWECDIRNKNCPTVDPNTVIFSTGDAVVINARPKRKKHSHF